MQIEDVKKSLYREGFESAYVQEDPPGKIYPDHMHDVKVAHIILDGGMELVVDGKIHKLKADDRFDVPAHYIHSAKIGPDGCRYLIGE